MSQAFIEHRRHAVAQLRVAQQINDEYMRKEAEKRAFDHLCKCAEALAILPKEAHVPLALYDTAKTMANILSRLGDNTCSAYQKLKSVAKGLSFEYRLDGQEAYTFDEFVDFYGVPDAFSKWNSAPVVAPSQRYSKTQLMLIGASIVSDNDQKPPDEFSLFLNSSPPSLKRDHFIDRRKHKVVIKDSSEAQGYEEERK